MTKTVSFPELVSFTVAVQTAQSRHSYLMKYADTVSPEDTVEFNDAVRDAQRQLVEAQIAFTAAVKKFNGSFA